MLFNAHLHREGDIVIQHEQRLSERQPGRAQSRERDGTHQEERSQDRKDALGNHIYSFSFFMFEYNPLTTGA